MAERVASSKRPPVDALRSVDALAQLVALEFSSFGSGKRGYELDFTRRFERRNPADAEFAQLLGRCVVRGTALDQHDEGFDQMRLPVRIAFRYNRDLFDVRVRDQRLFHLGA
jgi:hypothetical protein